MNEGEEHLPTIKQELMKMVKAEGSVTYDCKSNSSTDVDADLPKKGRISGWYCNYVSSVTLQPINL